MPSLTIFAGPNGSGKSSIIRGVYFPGRNNLLDADAIAVRIDPTNPPRAVMKAGREVIFRTQEYLRLRQEFAIETTLSGSWTTSAMGQARASRFFVRLLYVCLDDPEQNIQRVRERVSYGGHHIPDGDVRRRYSRSLANLKLGIKIADETLIYDNAGSEPKLIIEIRSGIVVSKANKLPAWAPGLLEGA